jgi:hypothetical protein
MADDTDTSGETGSPGTRPIAGGSSVPREKPVIEGHAEEIGVSTAPASEAPAEQAPIEDPWTVLPSPPEAEVLPPEPEAAFPASPEAEVTPEPQVGPPQATPAAPWAAVLWSFAAAIVIAALLAVGGAFGLHMLDRTPVNLAPLEARVAALEQRPASSEALHATQAGLESRIAALEAANRESQTTLAGLRADLDKLAAQKAAPGPSAAPDLAPLEGRLGALEQKLAALDTKLSGIAGRLDAEKSQVRASETRVGQSAAARADSEAIAILAANLLRKVDSGAPYGTDLAALANRGLETGKTAPLEPAAASGVATPAALAKQFSDVSPAILATQPPPQENGFIDHLVKGAERLVKVHKVGETPGNDLAGQVARIQAALDAGAINEAYQQWNELPDAAKAKSQAFGTAAKARIDTIAAARSIDADAMAALGKAKS